MASVQAIYQTLGCTYVTTYIQSGNVVFQSADSAAKLGKGISQALHKEFDYKVPVLVHEAAFLRQVLANNPFEDCEPSSLHVTLLGDAAGLLRLANLVEKTKGQDTFVLQSGAVYVHCPQGYGRTPLNNAFFEAKAKTWATTRNWETIGKVVELAHKIDSNMNE